MLGIRELWPVILVAALYALWVWMLIECIAKESREGNDRIVWLLVILIGQFVGGIV